MSAYASVGEVATLLGLSTKSVYKLLKARKLPGAFRLSGASPWMFDKNILAAHLKKMAERPAPVKDTTGNKSRHGL